MKYIITEEQFSTIQSKNPYSIIKKIKYLYNAMETEGICNLDVIYDEEDNNLSAYLVIDSEWYFSDSSSERQYKDSKVRKYRKDLKKKINDYLGITLYIGLYVGETPCEK